MKQWEELSADALTAMSELGGFGPTVTAENKTVKGRMFDDECGHTIKVYYSSTDLRNFAAGLLEVANWLDARAALPEMKGCCPSIPTSQHTNRRFPSQNQAPSEK